MNRFTLPACAVCCAIAIHPSSLVAEDDATKRSTKPARIKPTGKVEKVHDGFAFTEGPAWDPSGVLYFTDIPNKTIHKLAGDDKLSVFTDDSKTANGIFITADGRMLVCQMEGQVVEYDQKSGESKILAKEYLGMRFNAPNDLVIDKEGGIYFTDPLFRAPQPLPQLIQAVYYIAPGGEVRRVTADIAAPNGIALSPDGKQLYVIPSHQSEMLVYDVDDPGVLSGMRTLCRVKQPEGKSDTGGDGMVVDVEGNLYITTHLGVQIFSPDGKRRGLVVFPEQPANVTLAGPDRKTMYVTARNGLYRVGMPIAGLPPN